MLVNHFLGGHDMREQVGVDLLGNIARDEVMEHPVKKLPRFHTVAGGFIMPGADKLREGRLQGGVLGDTGDMRGGTGEQRPHNIHAGHLADGEIHGEMAERPAVLRNFHHISAICGEIGDLPLGDLQGGGTYMEDRLSLQSHDKTAEPTAYAVGGPHAAGGKHIFMRGDDLAYAQIIIGRVKFVFHMNHLLAPV